MKARVRLLAASVVLVALGAVLTIQGGSFGHTRGAQPENPPAGRPGDDSDKPKRPEDDAAVRKATAEFALAVEKGDARAVAAFWTEEGEYIGEDGTTLRGRAEIEATYARQFAKKKKTKVDLHIESVRFPSKDTAIEEGYAKSYKDGSELPTCSRFSLMYARESGKWLIALLREWPDEGVALRDLDWLIGSWEAKNDDADVRTTYAWDAHKNSIRCQITIKSNGRTVNAIQVLLKDPRNGLLRSWIFDDEGTFGDGAWSVDGKRWRIAASGVQADGGELTATNLITPVDKNTFFWQSTERTLDGEDLPNIPPIKVTRVK
jgi:uncharacterized protein (TIGR02246 family)